MKIESLNPFCLFCLPTSSVEFVWSSKQNAICHSSFVSIRLYKYIQKISTGLFSLPPIRYLHLHYQTTFQVNLSYRLRLLHQIFACRTLSEDTIQHTVGSSCYVQFIFGSYEWKMQQVFIKFSVVYQN